MTRPLIALLFLAGLPGFAAAAGGGAALESANINLSNQASLQRGARNFVNYCMGCHSAQYVRYNRLAEDIGLSEDQMVTNLMWAAEKPHETMEIAMAENDAERWFGVTPPDLSLVARARGKDYLYTFLKGFYVDESRPAGVNNVALPGASMPHVLWQLQGLRRPLKEIDAGGHEVISGYETVLEGQLTEEEYDSFVLDLVNFLVYIAEPVKLERERLGVWVLFFLLVLLLMSYMLKQEYWKDVH
jgi:ubiquinol-cytochrome c reductase cytochrome c1 subunit